MERKIHFSDLLLLSLLSSIIVFPFLGRFPLFDWDEINFAECARELLLTGQYLHATIDFEPFVEKPPFFFWLQALSMKLFGVNEFAARFPNAVVGVLTILCLYWSGTQLWDRQYGFLLALLYLGTLLPQAYFKSGIIDPTYNFLTFLSAYFVVKYEWNRLQVHPYRSLNWLAPLWAGFFAGLATLAKGPTQPGLLFITFLLYRLFFQRGRLPWNALFLAAFSYLLVVGIWVLLEIRANGTWFLEGFLKYHVELYTQPVAGHEQPFYYHFLVLSIGCLFLVSFFPVGLFYRSAIPEIRLLKHFMVIWFWVILLTFSFAKTKIIHYSSMTYFPMVFISGLYFKQVLEHQGRIHPFSYGYLLVVSLLWFLFLLFVPLFGIQKELFLPSLKEVSSDPNLFFALETEVPWQWWDFFPAFLWLVGILLILRFLRNRAYVWMLFAMAFAVGSFVNSCAYFLIPKIGEYTQGPLIRFCQSLERKSAFVTTYGYKSYAHYFYTQKDSSLKLPTQDLRELQRQGLPIYVSLKREREEEFREHYPEFHLLKREGMYAFYYWSPASSKGVGSN